MITPVTQCLPFIINKEKQHFSEGNFSLYFYSRKIVHKNKVRYKYEPLRFDGQEARFKTKSDARKYAKYRLALD